MMSGPILARAAPCGHSAINAYYNAADGRKTRKNDDFDDGRKTCHERDGTGLLSLFRLGAGADTVKSLEFPRWSPSLCAHPVQMVKLKPDPLPDTVDKKKEGGDDELTVAHPSAKEDHGVFVEISRILDKVGPDYVGDMKESVLRRLPGCRKLVKRAMEEASHNDQSQDALLACEAAEAEPAQPGGPAELDEVDTRRLQRFVKTFRKCDNICVAVLLRDGLKGRYPEPSDKELVDCAYTKVYGS